MLLGSVDDDNGDDMHVAEGQSVPAGLAPEQAANPDWPLTSVHQFPGTPLQTLNVLVAPL